MNVMFVLKLLCLSIIFWWFPLYWAAYLGRIFSVYESNWDLIFPFMFFHFLRQTHDWNHMLCGEQVALRQHSPSTPLQRVLMSKALARDSVTGEGQSVGKRRTKSLWFAVHAGSKEEMALPPNSQLDVITIIQPWKQVYSIFLWGFSFHKDDRPCWGGLQTTSGTIWNGYCPPSPPFIRRWLLHRFGLAVYFIPSFFLPPLPGTWETIMWHWVSLRPSSHGTTGVHWLETLWTSRRRTQNVCITASKKHSPVDLNMEIDMRANKTDWNHGRIS